MTGRKNNKIKKKIWHKLKEEDKLAKIFRKNPRSDNPIFGKDGRWYPASKYGGSLEFIRDEIGDAGFKYDYMIHPDSEYDNHPNKIGQLVFYEKVMKRWLREFFYEN